MKYSSKNKPLVCMQTQSTCYKGTTKMTPKGILWHGTGANNPNLRRYIQPSDVKPSADTYTKEEWLKILGKNTNGNDWNHIKREAGLNCWIGKLADGTVTTIQTMPWDYKPWGCGSGSKGSCNDGWMQFEICEDSLTDKKYFEAAYKEACEITAYYCKLYDINPLGTVTHKGVTVPTILCHQDSYKLKLGSNHSDVYNWFNKYGKTMDDARKDVAKLLNGGGIVVESTTTTSSTSKNAIKVTYQIWDDVNNKWLPDVVNDSDYAGIFGHDVCAVYANLSEGDCVYKVHTQGGSWLPEVKNREDYAGMFNKPVDGFMIKSTNPDVKIYYQVHIRGGSWLSYVSGYDASDDDNGYAGIIGKPIDGIRMYAEKTTTVTSAPTTPVEAEVQKYYRIRTSWADSKSQKGAYTSLESAKKCCQEAGEGYKVFDWNGTEVYSYIAPVATEPVKTEDAKPQENQIEKEPVEAPDAVPESNTIVNDANKEDLESSNSSDKPEIYKDPEVIEKEDEPTQEDPQIDTEKVSSLVSIISKIITAILKFFGKKIN